MISNIGLERERDLIMADIQNLKIGRGTGSPCGLDTGLEDQVSEVEAGVKVLAPGKYQIAGRLNSATANGCTLQEIGATCSTGLYDRLVVLPVAKTPDIEVQYEITIERKSV